MLRHEKSKFYHIISHNFNFIYTALITIQTDLHRSVRTVLRVWK